MENESMEELLECARGQAVSIGAYNQPDNPVYIGSESTEYSVFHYFQDNEGRFYYESERTLQFDRKMQEAQKKPKQKSGSGH